MTDIAEDQGVVELYIRLLPSLFNQQFRYEPTQRVFAIDRSATHMVVKNWRRLLMVIDHLDWGRF
jgi:hypothetical protein